MKLSIVVPVYNVQPYIKKSIQSLVNQNVPKDEYEIIIVDDGSPDKSIQIVEETFSEPNICIVRKQNGGLSSARNAGFAVAQGEYVWFVDSDDWIEENCLKDLYGYLDGTDVIAFANFTPEGREPRKDIIVSSNVENAPHDLLVSYKHTEAQLYIYRSSFLQISRLHFYEGIYHEDVEFNPRMLYLAKSLKVYNKPLYHFYANNDSISTVYRPKRCYDYMKLMNSLLEFRNQKMKKSEFKIFDHSLSEAILTLLLLSQYADEQVKANIDSFFSQNKDLKFCLLNSIRLNTRLLGYFSIILCFIPLRKLYLMLSKVRYK